MPLHTLVRQLRLLINIFFNKCYSIIAIALIHCYVYIYDAGNICISLFLKDVDVCLVTGNIYI